MTAGASIRASTLPTGTSSPARRVFDESPVAASGLSTLNHHRLPGGASRLAASLIAHLCPTNSLFAPCDPGAALGRQVRFSTDGPLGHTGPAKATRLANRASRVW